MVRMVMMINIMMVKTKIAMIQGVFFSLVPPLKVLSTKKLIWAKLGVSRPIYVNVDSPNLGFTYFNFLGGYQLKKHPVCMRALLLFSCDAIWRALKTFSC